MVTRHRSPKVIAQLEKLKEAECKEKLGKNTRFQNLGDSFSGKFEKSQNSSESSITQKHLTSQVTDSAAADADYDLDFVAEGTHFLAYDAIASLSSVRCNNLLLDDVQYTKVFRKSSAIDGGGGVPNIAQVGGELTEAQEITQEYKVQVSDKREHARQVIVSTVNSGSVKLGIELLPSNVSLLKQQ